MLTQLLADAKALADGLPVMQSAIDAVQADIGAGPIDTAKLATDAKALSDSAEVVVESIANLQADLAILPQATAPTGDVEALTPQQRCRLATLAVFGLEMATAFGVTIPPQIIALAQQLQAAACAVPPAKGE